MPIIVGNLFLVVVIAIVSLYSVTAAQLMMAACLIAFAFAIRFGYDIPSNEKEFRETMTHASRMIDEHVKNRYVLNDGKLKKFIGTGIATIFIFWSSFLLYEEWYGLFIILFVEFIFMTSAVFKSINMVDRLISRKLYTLMLEEASELAKDKNISKGEAFSEIRIRYAKINQERYAK